MIAAQAMAAHHAAMECSRRAMLHEQPFEAAQAFRKAAANASRTFVVIRFITRRDLPYTNNACERALRPSVIFRKVM